VKPHVKETLNHVFAKLADLFFAGIICVIISSLITTGILENIEAKSQDNRRMALLSRISIGTNQSWVDENFGTPQFMANKDEYLLCVYTSDNFLLQVVYSDHSVQGYLITAFEEGRVEIEDLTSFFDDGIELGRFSFYDFPDAPISAMGFISNGASRALYAETYYLASQGNYLNYYIAYFDYGFAKGNSEWGFFEVSAADDEMTADQLSPNASLILTNRKKSYPNTYGASVFGLDMEQLLFTYDWFDSVKLTAEYRSK
jgi:hypothetical protein